MDSWEEGEGYEPYVGRWSRPVAREFVDFDDLWRPFILAQGPAPGYVASLEPGDRDRLRTVLHESLPKADDGSIHLTARAWAVSGVAS